MKNLLIVVSAPSGAGKTTIVKKLLETFPDLKFSISACSRTKRINEVDGVDYYFMSADDFKLKIQNDEFLEWQEVYEGSYYGSLKSEVDRIWSQNNYVIFDVDVVGGLNIKKIYKDKALSIFIMPPSIELLEERLRKRSTDSEESIRIRVEKARKEMEFSNHFDHIIINDDISKATNEAVLLIKEFLNK
jgi:guanylate kinase